MPSKSPDPALPKRLSDLATSDSGVRVAWANSVPIGSVFNAGSSLRLRPDIRQSIAASRILDHRIPYE